LVARYGVLAALVFLFIAGGWLCAEEVSRPAQIRVVMDDNYPPFAFHDGTGNLQGILIDQWRLWEKKTGIKVELHGMSWARALTLMQAGEFDVIDTIFKTHEREQYFDFTAAYQKIEVAFFFENEISGLTDAKSLQGFVVGVKAGDVVIGQLRENGVDALQSFDSYEALVKAAKERKITVFAMDRPPALYYLHKFKLDQNYRQGAPLWAGELHRAVGKGNAKMLGTVEAGFASISKAELAAIDEKWYGVETISKRSLRKLLPVASGVALLVVVLFIWNATLRRAVRRHTAALKASEERFQSIYHSVNDAIFIHDLNTGRILDVNQRMCEIYGCTVEEARRFFVNDLSSGEPPYSEEEALTWMKKAVAGQPQVFTWHCRRKDKSLFWGEVRMRRAHVGHDDVIVVTVSDITARRTTEMALYESTERFRQMAENIEEVFWMSDVTGDQVLYVSPAYEKIWGRSCESLYGQPASWIESVHPDDRERVRKIDSSARNEGLGYTEVYRITRPDGQVRWINDRAFPVRDGSGRIYRVVGIATDITEHRSLDQQFRHAQKMEALGTLAGGIAHDFNNILGAITGYAELAKLDSTQPSVQSCHDEILRASKRASDLVRQILAFSRQQEQQRKPLPLWPIVNEAVQLLRAVFPSTIEFLIESEQDAPNALIDPSQIHQVVMNLCTNAMQALPNKVGKLGVKVDVFSADEKFARVHPNGRIGRYARLTISDNGQGIDPVILERIYEPFFTTKAPGEGTGLGLAVVHGIVQNHQGIITVESQPGQGTRFQIFFPEHSAHNVEAGNKTDAFTPGSGQRILVVDDEDMLVRMAAKALTKLGYLAETKQDPLEALQALRTGTGCYDLIITDLTMPSMSGLEFAEQVTLLKPGIPIILMTGFFAKLTDAQLAQAGIKEVMLKPVTLKGLSETIDRLLKI
jgi:PAS domain S-box-containing protein